MRFQSATGLDKGLKTAANLYIYNMIIISDVKMETLQYSKNTFHH